MAANVGSSLKWQELLPEHSVFQRLSQRHDNASSGIREGSQQSITNNILIENDGEIFIWDYSKSSILTINLKNLHFENERSDKFQEFVCTEAPLFVVDFMLFSPSSKYLLLMGERGISVLEMPMRWGKFAEYDGGSESVICRTIPIDPRFYVTHHKISVLDVKWHPGSQADIHLLVLTSDNNLRLYSVLKPTSPEEIISLGESSSLTAEYSRKSLSVGSMSSFAAALGEKAIAFDFASPTAAPVPRARLNSSDARTDVTHPIFVLRENGDIYYLVHRISQMRCQPQLIGPLTMYPAADDNYGLDACSLLCLHSQPSVIAMATASGKIYHCIVLESEESYDPEEEVESWNSHGIVKSDECQPNLSLFVHECVELQVSLLYEAADRSSTGDYSDENENMALLRLQRDPGSPYQYHCSHDTGVHSVSLPWAKKLQSYCMQDGEGSFDPEEAAVVYHMICTSPTAARLSSLILGVCVVDSRILGSSMLCFTSKMECIVKPLSLLNRPPSPSKTDTDEETSYKSAAFSPIRHLNVGLFKSQIEKILTRNTSTPLLRAGEESEKLSHEDCYQLLIQAQEILRKEYIQKQNKAREEIEKRISILEDQKKQQNQHLVKLHKISDELRDQAGALGGKVDDTSERHRKLLKRLESLFRFVHNGIPVLSHAESQMKKELEDIKTSLQFHRESLEQIKAKNNYSKKSPRKSTPSKLPVVNVSQQNNIRNVLSDESEMITDLVNQVKELKLQVGL